MFEVLGQNLAKEYIGKSLRNNRISHSYIITGPDGIGKSIFAFHIASALLCIGENNPCGKCAPCKKILHGNHPDVKIISNGKKTIGVNEIRSLIDEVNTKPYEGEKKIVIIKNAHNITVEGQNAILKTLEEPPDNVVIIMLAENVNSLLQTIQSRCQIIKLNRVSTGEITEFLESQGIDSERASIASEISDGIPGNALRFLDKRYMDLRNNTIEVAQKSIKQDALAVFEIEKFFSDNKDDIEIIFDILGTWFRDITVVKTTRMKKNIINKDFYELLVEESKLLSYNRLDRIIDTIKDTREKIKQYANFQLAVEMMLLKFQEV